VLERIGRISIYVASQFELVALKALERMGVPERLMDRLVSKVSAFEYKVFCRRRVVKVLVSDLEFAIDELSLIQGELECMAEDDLDYQIDLAYGLGEVIRRLSKYCEVGA